MFDQAGVTAYYQQHKDTFKRVAALEEALNHRLFGMEHAVECMMLSALSGEAMVLIGPPGTAKSRLVRVFCNLVGVLDDSAIATSDTRDGVPIQRSTKYFEYLLTQFTEPAELFGYFDLAKLQRDGDLVRMTDGMMQEADIVFLDEVFNANSAILNSLLTIMNERMFHDRGDVVRSPLKLLFSATNHMPQEPNLQAVFDRFLLRAHVTSAASERGSITEMLRQAWSETNATPTGGERPKDFEGLLDEIDLVRRNLQQRTASGEIRIDPLHPMMANLTDLVRSVRTRGLSELSNRRLVKLASIVLYLSFLRAARLDEDNAIIQPDDLDAVVEYGLDIDDPSARSQLRENWQDRS